MERPDAILPGIGGQTGLNLAVQLEKKGILKECNVELLGTSSKSIERAEDRELFKELCQSIGEPTIPSEITYSIDKAKAFGNKYGGAAAYSSINEMAESPDVDAVYIAVPNSVHAQYALACMNAGKHVLCEKPARHSFR